MTPGGRTHIRERRSTLPRSIVLLGRGLLGFNGSQAEFREALWRAAGDAGRGEAHAFPLIQLIEAAARLGFLDPPTDPPEAEYQPILEKARALIRFQRLCKRCVRKLQKEGRGELPKPSVLDKPYPFNNTYKARDGKIYRRKPITY